MYGERVMSGGSGAVTGDREAEGPSAAGALTPGSGSGDLFGARCRAGGFGDPVEKLEPAPEALDVVLEGQALVGGELGAVEGLVPVGEEESCRREVEAREVGEAGLLAPAASGQEAAGGVGEVGGQARRGCRPRGTRWPGRRPRRGRRRPGAETAGIGAGGPRGGPGPGPRAGGSPARRGWEDR